MEAASNIFKQIPENIDYAGTAKILSVDPSPLNVVLLQEVSLLCFIYFFSFCDLSLFFFNTKNPNYKSDCLSFYFSLFFCVWFCIDEDHLTFQIQRYNILLDEMRASLISLEKGVHGLVVMTVELENTFNCIYDGRVPPGWAKVRHFLIKFEHLISLLEGTSSRLNSEIAKK